MYARGGAFTREGAETAAPGEGEDLGRGGCTRVRACVFIPPAVVGGNDPQRLNFHERRQPAPHRLHLQRCRSEPQRAPKISDVDPGCGHASRGCHPTPDRAPHGITRHRVFSPPRYRAIAPSARTIPAAEPPLATAAGRRRRGCADLQAARRQATLASKYATSPPPRIPPPTASPAVTTAHKRRAASHSASFATRQAATSAEGVNESSAAVRSARPAGWARLAQELPPDKRCEV